MVYYNQTGKLLHIFHFKLSYGKHLFLLFPYTYKLKTIMLVVPAGICWTAGNKQNIFHKLVGLDGGILISFALFQEETGLTQLYAYFSSKPAAGLHQDWLKVTRIS